MDGPTDKSGEFHLIVTKPPPGRAANTENESFASVLLQSPLADKPHLAFVRKNSEIFDTVQAATDSGVMFSPVLEVAIVRSAEAVLGWDQETGMPSRATLYRAAQLAWISSRSHELATSDDFRKERERAEDTNPGNEAKLTANLR